MRNRVQPLPLHLANRLTCNINHRLRPSCLLRDIRTRPSNQLSQTIRPLITLSPMLVSQTCINNTISRQVKQQPWLPQPQQANRLTATRCLRRQWVDHHGWEVSQSRTSEHPGHHPRARVPWALCLRKCLRTTGCLKATWDTRSAVHMARTRRQG